ncbi:hypothetical protein [Alkalihalobacterium bogoriense]|uniref:hypothetical protein n=1 Tax=Alkalihalobacterium bogoriense TaxID=246272 RepID=UPI00047A1138|nr:hypothetical protein [Alkalihalobacterium bogoriense]
MSSVKELYLTSKELFDLVQTPLPEGEDERDQFISEIFKALDARERVIMQYQKSAQTLTASEKTLAEEIVKMNAKIATMLADSKDKIGLDISNLKMKQQQGKKYDNPYDGPTVDGVFFDKRGV